MYRCTLIKSIIMYSRLSPSRVVSQKYNQMLSVVLLL
uniref:Uncharacterized protein n=1 Tax=Anguilla anguilla TaxID=7936 RepID=A0A0E9XYY0_ANGAN